MDSWGRVLVVVALAAPVLAEDEPAVVLPIASQGVEVQEEIVFDLNRAGELRFKDKTRTLDEFANLVDQAKRVYNLKQKAHGRSGEEKVGRFLVPRLRVLLRVHEDEPWQHVQWIRTILIEQRIYKLQFAVRKGEKGPAARLDAFLPINVAIDPPPKAPPNEINIGIHIVPRRERPIVYGPPQARQNVTMPTEVRYFHENEECGDLETVSKWIRHAREFRRESDSAAGARNVRYVGEIQAGHKVPFKYVVGVLNRFHEAGLKEVRFFGDLTPAPRIRRMPYLPYPLRNYAR